MYTYPILTTTTTTTATFTPVILEKNSISFQSCKEGFCRNNCIFYIDIQVMDMLMTLNREQRWALPSLWDPAGAELSVCASGGRGKLRSTWTLSPAACHNWTRPSASPPATWPRTAAAAGGRSGVDTTGGAPNLDEIWTYECMNVSGDEQWMAAVHHYPITTQLESSRCHIPNYLAPL